MEKILVRKGVKISYLLNKGKSPTLFFLHGAGSNKTIWIPYREAFKNYTWVAMDIRNHGKSGNGPTSMKEMVDDVLAIIKNEKLTKVILVGNSLGGVIAYHVAKKVKTAKVVSLSHYSKEYVRGSSILKPILTIAGKCFGVLPKRKRVFENYYKNTILHRFIKDLRGIYASDYCKVAIESMNSKAPLNKINNQTLVLMGEHDKMIKRHQMIIDCKKNPKVTFISLGSHHHILTQKCDFAIKLIKDFMRV